MGKIIVKCDLMSTPAQSTVKQLGTEAAEFKIASKALTEKIRKAPSLDAALNAATERIGLTEKLLTSFVREADSTYYKALESVGRYLELHQRTGGRVYSDGKPDTLSSRYEKVTQDLAKAETGWGKSFRKDKINSLRAQKEKLEQQLKPERDLRTIAEADIDKSKEVLDLWDSNLSGAQAFIALNAMVKRHNVLSGTLEYPKGLIYKSKDAPTLFNPVKARALESDPMWVVQQLNPEVLRRP